MSYQLIYPAIKQYSGNKVRGGDQSASLFSSPGYGKIDLSNKAFWKQCMLVRDPLASIEHFV